MGSVYRAGYTFNVTKLVAVKEMINSAPDPLVRETIVQNFEREANLLATLHHASIPKIYDYFSLESRCTWSWVYPGKDLRRSSMDTTFCRNVRC
jgi:serine/threonine protein kinase